MCIANLMQAIFGQTGMENEIAAAPTPGAFGAMASFLVPKLSVGLAGSLSHDRLAIPLDQSKLIKKERHAVRPPVKHNWSLPRSNEDMKSPQIFQHELLQNFSINMFCKVKIGANMLFACHLSFSVHLYDLPCFVAFLNSWIFGSTLLCRGKKKICFVKDCVQAAFMLEVK